MKVNNNGFIAYKKGDFNIRNDEIFKKVFGDNSRKYLVEHLLEAILGRKISVIDVKSEYILNKDFKDNKEKKLDLLVEVDEKEKINIEIQNKNEYNVIIRGMNYSSDIYYHSLKEGQKYTENYKTEVIWLLGFNLFKDGPYHEKGILKRDSNNNSLTEDVVYHYIQLPKFWEQLTEIITPEEQWLAYLSCQLNKEELEELREMNEDIDETEKIIERYMSDDALRDEIRGRFWAEYDKYDRERYAKKMGKVEDAQKMLKKDIDVEIIKEVTGLTQKEIDAIINDELWKIN